MSDTITSDSGKKYEFDGIETGSGTIFKLKPVEEEWPKEWDNYWAVYHDGSIKEYLWRGDEIDKNLQGIHNFFRTNQQATLAAEAIKELLKYIQDPENSWKAAYTQKALEARRAVNES